MGQISGHLYSFMNIKKNLSLVCFLLCTSLVFSQNISALKDSIIKFKGINPQKALDFSFKALNQFDLEEFSYDLVELNFFIGEIYYFKKDYDKSLKYLSQSLTIYESLTKDQRIHKNIKKLPWALMILGSVFYENENYEKAKTFYNEAITNFNLYEEKFKEDKIFGLNTSDFNLALVSKKQLKFEQAMYYYERTLDRINNELKENKNAYYLFTYLQILDLYFVSGKEDLAIKYFDLSTKLYQTESKSSEIQSIYSRIVSRYANHLKSKNQFRQAIIYFEKAKNLTTAPSYEISDINVSISECYIAIDEYEKAEKIYLKNIKNKDLSFKDRIKNFKGIAEVYSAQQRNIDLIEVYGSIIKLYTEKRTIINFNDLENQIVIAQKQREINENQLKSYRNNFITIVLVLLSTIVIIILVFNYNYQKVKNSKLESEKIQISTKLDSKNRELVSKANFILQRNEYLKNIKLKLDKNKGNEQSYKQISKEIMELINSDKYYREFDKTFTIVYPKFYKNLSAKFKLSQTYLRLAAYIKMNQSSNEIAKITGVTLRTVETQRYRLSKKLDLHKDQDLNTFLKNL